MRPAWLDGTYIGAAELQVISVARKKLTANGFTAHLLLVVAIFCFVSSTNHRQN